MNIEDCKSFLNYRPLKVGKAALVEKSKGKFSLLYDNRVWMNYNTVTHWQAADFLVEYNQAAGRVIVTGLGVGCFASMLCNNPNVKEVIVYEKFQDVIDLFYLLAEESGLQTKKLKIKCMDANEIKDEVAHSMCLLHHENNTVNEIFESVRHIANNNSVNFLWFWPATQKYLEYVGEKMLPINTNTFQQWSTSLNIKNFPIQVDEKIISDIISVKENNLKLVTYNSERLLMYEQKYKLKNFSQRFMKTSKE